MGGINISQDAIVETENKICELSTNMYEIVKKSKECQKRFINSDIAMSLTNKDYPRITGSLYSELEK